MTADSARSTRWRRPVLAVLAAAVLAAAAAVVTVTLLHSDSAGVDSAARPCDAYAQAHTPCVAAFSSTRALYADYAGRLYQVTRASDGTTKNIGVVSRGGYADAAEQDAFCRATACTITTIYDQSPRHNDLTVAGPGTAGRQNHPASATALPVTIDGHKAYGVAMPPQVGYRHRLASGTARGGKPESMYEVADGRFVNDRCCSDFGNVEADERDTGVGHMDTLNLSRLKADESAGNGPWVQADLENGVVQGGTRVNPKNTGNPSTFVTAVLKNDGQRTFALKGADSTHGPLTTWYDGALPARYSPMHQEGSIVLGTGGDNSNRGRGAFFEGAMTAGYAPDRADDAVQASVVAARYRSAT